MAKDIEKLISKWEHYHKELIIDSKDANVNSDSIRYISWLQGNAEMLRKCIDELAANQYTKELTSWWLI